MFKYEPLAFGVQRDRRNIPRAKLGPDAADEAMAVAELGVEIASLASRAQVKPARPADNGDSELFQCVVGVTHHKLKRGGRGGRDQADVFVKKHVARSFDVAQQVGEDEQSGTRRGKRFGSEGRRLGRVAFKVTTNLITEGGATRLVHIVSVASIESHRAAVESPCPTPLGVKPRRG